MIIVRNPSLAAFFAGKPWLIIFALFILFVISLAGNVEGDEQETGVTVLIYHRFGDERYPSTNVSAQSFKAQMAFLEDEGYQVIPLERLIRCLENDEKIPDRSVVITIDDAYRSILDVAWPILRSYAYSFTVFVYSGAVDKGYGDFLDWPQIREMAAAGVDFQDHGYSHHHMADVPSGMDDSGYEQWLRLEMKTSRRLLTKRLGKSPDFLAIPYGEYNDTVLAVARKLGYRAVFSQDPGSVSRFSDIYAIPREPILGKEWSGLDHFAKVLARVDLPLADRKPDSRSGYAGGVGARLLFPDRYLEGSVGVYVSGLGWQQAHRSGDYFSAVFPEHLPKKNTRVTFSGREKGSGRLAVRSWLLR